jgi:transcriptional regulator with XRE-family HTH domain
MVATMIPRMAIGDRIRDLRQAKGMTQEQLARAANLGLSHLARLEQGVITDPSWSTVRAVAQALGVAVTDLEDGKPKGEPQKRGRPKRKGGAE